MARRRKAKRIESKLNSPYATSLESVSKSIENLAKTISKDTNNINSLLANATVHIAAKAASNVLNDIMSEVVASCSIPSEKKEIEKRANEIMASISEIMRKSYNYMSYSEFDAIKKGGISV